MALALVQIACRVGIGTPAKSPVDATLDALHTQISLIGETQAAFTQAALDLSGAPVGQETVESNLATASAQVKLAATLEQPLGGPVNTPAPYEPDERLLKSARILLFEDMSASRYIRIVKEALDDGGYFYQDVGSAKGWFRTQLLSDVDWDLVIAAGEAEREFGGEFYEYIDQRVTDGAAAIIETWDLDQAPEGKAYGLLKRCGLKVEADWFEPEQKALFILQPENPIFLRPNAFTSMVHNAQSIWTGDLGDMLKVDPAGGMNGSQPTILAGTSPALKNSHGLLASCLGGRVILQTFRTHDYQHDDMLDLWQNYIYQALKSYYADNGQIVPTPAQRMLPTAEGTPTAFGPTPGPEYTFPHACAGVFEVRERTAPIFQQDLFEHHAKGKFLNLGLSIRNISNFPVMIWDKDYFVEAQVDDHTLEFRQDPAATGYLFIDRGTDLIQGVIQPGETWDISLAFDVDGQADGWTFIFRPGSKFNEQVCETRLPLTR